MVILVGVMDGSGIFIAILVGLFVGECVGNGFFMLCWQIYENNSCYLNDNNGLLYKFYHLFNDTKYLFIIIYGFYLNYINFI